MPINQVKIMGILNANEDSFYKKSRFSFSSAKNQILSMIEDGADIVDIGAVSSRPKSLSVSSTEELERLKDILDLIKKEKLYERSIFSLDSYNPIVVKYALDCGFKIINDISALQNDEVAKIIGEYKASVVLMHMQNTPKNMQDNPKYENVLFEVNNFFKKRILKAKKFNIENIILDPGIGFGKTLEHNITLIKNLDYFLHFGYEILLGASRKSMISLIIESNVEQRQAGTLAIHLEAVNKGASIIRCHDVKEHFQALSVQACIRL